MPVAENLIRLLRVYTATVVTCAALWSQTASNPAVGWPNPVPFEAATEGDKWSISAALAGTTTSDGKTLEITVDHCSLRPGAGPTQPYPISGIRALVFRDGEDQKRRQILQSVAYPVEGTVAPGHAVELARFKLRVDLTSTPLVQGDTLGFTVDFVPTAAGSSFVPMAAHSLLPVKGPATSREDYLAHFNLGRNAFEKGELDNAAREYQLAVGLRSDYIPARVALIQLSLRRGDVDIALKMALETLQIAPGNKTVKLLVAAGYLRKGNYAESRMQLEELLKDDPHNVDCLLELGVLNMIEKRYDDAQATFRTAYKADSSNPRGLVGVAEIYFQRSEPERAIQVLADEVKQHPQRLDLKKELANVEVRAMEYDKAVQEYQSILLLSQGNPMEEAEIYGKLAEANLRWGKLASAIEDSRKATELAPRNKGYRSQFAGELDRAGEREEAIVQYREAVKIDPNDRIIQNNLAFLLVDTGGNLDEALTLAERAKQGLPEFPEMADTLGWIYFKKDLLDKALPIFQELVQKAAMNSTFHYHLAAVLAKKGDRDEARKEVELALQIGSGNSVERQRILELQTTLLNGGAKP